MKKLFSMLLCLAMVLTMTACVFSTKIDATVPQKPGDPTQQAQMTFTVTVTHSDGSEQSFTYQTNAKMLGAYLEEQGLIESEGADDGMFHTVDGEKADWNETQSYWAFYLGEEYATTGIYDTPITDGADYRLVWTPA